MAITQKEKDLLQSILGKIDGLELVRLGGMVYDSILKAGLPTPKLMVLGKFIYANVPWANLPKEINDVRLLLVRSVEENFLKKLPDLFDLAQDIEAAPSEETSTSATPTPVPSVDEEPKNDVTANMESFPGGDTELPPADSKTETKGQTSPVVAAPAESPESVTEEEDDDPFDGTDDEDDEDEDEEVAEVAAVLKSEPETSAETPVETTVSKKDEVNEDQPPASTPS